MFTYNFVKNYIAKTMNSHSNPFHDKIFARYLELMKQEQEANPLRAQFLGVSYYAKAISDESWCVIQDTYVCRIINRYLKNGK